MNAAAPTINADAIGAVLDETPCPEHGADRLVADYMLFRSPMQRSGMRPLPVSGVDDAIAMCKHLGLNRVGTQDRVACTLSFRDNEVAGQVLVNRYGDLRWVSTSERAKSAARANVGSAS